MRNFFPQNIYTHIIDIKTLIIYKCMCMCAHVCVEKVLKTNLSPIKKATIKIRGKNIPSSTQFTRHN